MKVFKIIMNILGIIGASFLSILLVIALNVTPMVSAASSFLQGESIYKIISSVDYSEIISSEMELDGESLEGKIANELMKSEMMEELVNLCTDNIFETIDSNGESDPITPDDIEDIAKDHEDELKKIIKEHIGNDIPLTEDVLDEMTDSLIEEYSVELAETLPTAEDLGLSPDVLNIIMNLRNNTYFWIAFGIAAGLTLLVMLCQVMRFKGFMWIGVDYLVAAVFTLISSFVIKALDLCAIMDLDAAAAPVMETVTGIISSEMLKGAAIEAGLGIVFIVVFIVGRKILKKKLITLLLVVAMCMPLVACGESKADPIVVDGKESAENEAKEIKTNEDGYVVLTKEELLPYFEVVELNADNWTDYYTEIMVKYEAETNNFGEVEQEAYERPYVLEKTPGQIVYTKDTAIKFVNAKYIRYDNGEWQDTGTEAEPLVFENFGFTMTDFYSVKDAKCLAAVGKLVILTVPDELWTLDENGGKHLIVQSGGNEIDLYDTGVYDYKRRLREEDLHRMFYNELIEMTAEE